MALKWAVPWRPASDNSAKLEVPRALAQPMAGGIHFLQRMAMSRSLMTLEQPVLRKKFQLGIRLETHIGRFGLQTQDGSSWSDGLKVPWQRTAV